MSDAPNMTPEMLAQWCLTRQDADRGSALLREWSATCERLRIDLATQMMVLAYIAAEVERSAPERGITGPALRLLTDRSAAALRLHDQPAGHA